ncbi:MAG: histidine phosphatase family protein, partial [Actinomycetales bacterium]
MTDAGTRRLLVLRHGETLDNAAGIWQGRKDSELSPIGLVQADRAAPVVAAYQPEV